MLFFTTVKLFKSEKKNLNELHFHRPVPAKTILFSPPCAPRTDRVYKRLNADTTECSGLILAKTSASVKNNHLLSYLCPCRGR